ncbi:hypothetical protein MNBD_GAMMA11-2707 [hydrothermal vent metagenome]|uniref:Transposase TnpC homeodomain domain-containing protein n=1 Tax=hydrothermal vent metagenome TaxID=652676 RepID=A0A3B0X972_9ZZZZ
MSNASLTAKYDLLLQENAELKQDIVLFKKQLEWFKQQVFGQKTERRLIDIPAEQQHLFETEPVENTPDAQTQSVKYERKKPKQRGNAVTDAGLRFDDTVEVKEIHINAAELNGENDVLE